VKGTQLRKLSRKHYGMNPIHYLRDTEKHQTKIKDSIHIKYYFGLVWYRISNVSTIKIYKAISTICICLYQDANHCQDIIPNAQIHKVYLKKAVYVRPVANTAKR